MAEKKKLSKKTLAKSFRNWSYGNLTCFSQEHMQTFGYLCAMLPIVEELYDTPEEQKQALQTYSAFFNTEPQIGTMIVGVTAGLEEARANGEAIDDDAINGIRAGLMGPLADRRYPDPDPARYRPRSLDRRLPARRYLLYRRVEPAHVPRHALCLQPGL